jgi:hypothetical protein
MQGSILTAAATSRYGDLPLSAGFSGETDGKLSQQPKSREEEQVGIKHSTTEFQATGANQ